MRIDLANGLGDGDVVEIARAASKHVHDPSVFRVASRYLAPKWGGTPEGFLKFVGEAADLTKSSYGDTLYFWMIYQASVTMPEAELARFPVDRDRMKRGSADMIRLAPDWIPAYHRVAAIARIFKDLPTAVEMFKRPELAWYDGAEGVWRSRFYYDNARIWALGLKDAPPIAVVSGERPNPVDPEKRPILVPQFKGEPANWPRIVTPLEMAIDGVVRRHVAFVAESGERAAIFTALPYQQSIWRPVDLIASLSLPSPWKMNDGGKVRLVTGIEGNHPLPGQMTVQLQVSPAMFPRTAKLKLRPMSEMNPLMPPRLFIVGCEFVGAECRQKVLEGKVNSEFRHAGTATTYTLEVREQFDPEGFTGAPVLDEDGFVRLITKRMPIDHKPPGTIVIAAEDVARVGFPVR